MNEADKKERSKEARYYAKKRKEVRKILEEFGCIKSSSFSDLKNYRFLAVIGCSHFYVIDQKKGKLTYNQRKNTISFTYEGVFLNIYVAGIDNSTGINRLEDMTVATKIYHHLDEEVGNFKLDRGVYCISQDITEFIRELDPLLRRGKLQQEKIDKTEETEEDKEYAAAHGSLASFLQSV